MFLSSAVFPWTLVPSRRWETRVLLLISSPALCCRADMPIGHYARVGAVFPWLSFCIPFLVLVTISKSHNVQLLNRRFTDEDFEALSRPVPRHYPSGHQHIMAEVLSLTPSFLPKDWPIQDQAGHQDAPGPHSMFTRLTPMPLYPLSSTLSSASTRPLHACRHSYL